MCSHNKYMHQEMITEKQNKKTTKRKQKNCMLGKLLFGLWN